MQKKSAIIIATLLASVAPSAAFAACTIPNTLTNGQLADATQVMANFNALATCTVAPAGSTGSVQINGGAGALAGVGPLTNGQLVIGSTGGNPLAANLTAGSGVTITNGSGSIVIAATGSSGGAGPIPVNAQTGTSYTAVTADQGKLLLFSNSGSVAVTLPQAGTTGFAAGWWTYLKAAGGSSITVSTTTSTIDGVATYAVQNTGTIIVVSDGTNWQVIPLIAFNSANTGGYSLQKADSTASGGSPRGSQAIDMQLSRSAASQVASGTSSFAAGSSNTASGNYSSALGQGNTASGGYSVAVGIGNSTGGLEDFAGGNGNTTSAFGQNQYVLGSTNSTSANFAGALGRNHTVSGAYGLALGGQSSTVAGAYSTIGGYFGGDNGNNAELGYNAFTLNNFALGQAQWTQLIFGVRTSGATAVRLTTDGTGTASATNVGALFTNYAYTYTGECVIADATNGRVNTYSFAQSLIIRGATASATVMGTGNPVAVAGPKTSTGLTLAAVPTITADTTRGGLNISFTPPASNTDNINAVCRLRGVATYNG